MSDEQKNELGTIKNREDILLAKIAGYDVDITTMTPPVLNGVREKILDEIAKRVTAIEQGGGGGSAEPLIVNLIGDQYTSYLDASYNEIKTAFMSGTPVYMNSSDETVRNYTILTMIHDEEGLYEVTFADGTGFTASDPNANMQVSDGYQAIIDG